MRGARYLGRARRNVTGMLLAGLAGPMWHMGRPGGLRAPLRAG
jgi:hypothetical protein